MAGGTLTESLEETLAVFDGVDGSGEPLTTNEVTEQLPISRRSTYARLERLAEDGYLRTKKVGSRGRVWWRPPTEPQTDEADDSSPGSDVHVERLIDNTPGMVYRCLDEPGWPMTFVSDACADITGYDPEELEADEVSWGWDVVHPEDRERVADEIAAQLREGSQFTVQYRVVTADGDVRWVSERGNATSDDGDGRRFLEGVVTDVTEQEAVKRELAERERQLREEKAFVESILDNQRDLVYAVDPDGTFTRWNDRFVEVTGYTDEEIAEMHATEFIADGAVEETVAAIEAVIQQGESKTLELPLVTADGTEIPYEFTGTPIRNGDGDIVGLAGVGRDISERKAKERELTRRRDDLESELEEIYGRITDAFFALDTDWRFTHVNEHARELVDPEGEGLEGANIWEAFPEAVDSTFEREYRTAMDTQEATTFEAYYPDPLDAWFEVHAYPSETGLSVYFRDVTERKEHERDLELYETIVETIDDGVYVLDDEFRFTQVNDAYVEMTGYSREELLGAHSSLVVDESVSEQSAEALQRIVDGETSSVAIEANIQRADGTELPAESRFTALPSRGENPPRKVGVVRDVSERRERERELEQYETVAETATDVIITIDDESRIQSVNPAVETTFGYAPEDLVGESLTTLLPEQFADDHHEGIAEYLETGDRTLDWDYVELSGVDADGEEVPLAISFSEYEYGGEHYFTGIMRDISERKERERELEESERRYRTIAEYFPNGTVTLFDHDFTYTLAAGQGFDDVPVDPEDVEGRHFREAWGEETADALEPVFEAALDGEERWVEVSYAGAEWVVRGAPITDERGEVFAGMTTAQNITEHKERERELVRQREQLAALNDVNEVVQEITDAAIEQSTREEIESVVCERLADTDSYQFAWIGDVDANSKTVNARTAAGTDGYLDDVTISTDPDDERSEGPTGMALRTGEVQTSQDVRNDSQYEPWRDVAAEYGFRSSAAIPITHADTVYGVLSVYADRPNAFEDQERAVISQLGEIVGHAIAAVERKRALMSDEVVELRFHIQDIFESLGTDTDTDGTIWLEETVPIEDGEYLVYGNATPDAADGVAAIAEAVPYWERVRFREDDTHFEARLSEPPVLSAVASLGGAVEEAVIEDGDYHMTLHLAPSADTRQLVDVVRDAYPAAEMVARRQTTRPGADSEQIDQVFAESLTDRQRAALRAAYHAGFFEWPREASGEDVAAALDVAAPTFHQHLRKAEQKIFESLLSSSV